MKHMFWIALAVSATVLLLRPYRATQLILIVAGVIVGYTWPASKDQR